MHRITIGKLTRAEIERVILKFVFENADEADPKALMENVKSAKRSLAGGLTGTDNTIPISIP